jgi:hypothetical protein
VEGALESFSRFTGEGVRHRFAYIFRVVMHGLAEETNLLSIAPAPFADEQMKSQPEALRQWQGSVKRIGLEPADLAAGGHEDSEPCLECGGQVFQELHVKAPL